MDRETRDRIRGEVNRAAGVLMLMYGLIRDNIIGSLVDDSKAGFFGSAVQDTLEGLMLIPELIDGEDESNEDHD